MDLLAEQADPQLGLCPDIGWVMKGERDVVQFLNSNRERVGALHLKDFATASEKVDTVVLGTGVAPLAEAAGWALEKMDGGWMIAEQDSAELDPAEAVRRNAAYMRQIFQAG
jgi:sugar phosphate isomerase/epimerase